MKVLKKGSDVSSKTADMGCFCSPICGKLIVLPWIEENSN